MSSWIILPFVATGLAMLVPAGAPRPDAQTQGAKDPNERVCEEIVYTGSRLGVRRVCATRAEWEERKRLDKEAIDRAQMSPNGPCSTVNTHSGGAAC